MTPYEQGIEAAREWALNVGVGESIVDGVVEAFLSKQPTPVWVCRKGFPHIVRAAGNRTIPCNYGVTYGHVGCGWVHMVPATRGEEVNT